MSGNSREGMRIGIDLGGSKYRLGLVNLNSELIGDSIRISVDEINNADDLIDSIAISVKDLMSSQQVAREEIIGVGMGSPGPLDIKSGVILHTLNMTYLRDFPLLKRMKEKLSMEVVLGNDANCFVLGQQIAGAAKGCINVFGITLGTGFGCGMIIDGRLYEGATGTAAEYGISHYLEGEFEDYVSGRGLKSIYKNISGNSKRPFEIEETARRGAPEAMQAFAEFGRHVGNALSHVVNLIDPEMIVIGGSIANSYDLFIEPLKKSLLSGVSELPAQNLKIRKAENGELNTIIGAAKLFDSRKNINPPKSR